MNIVLLILSFIALTFFFALMVFFFSCLFEGGVNESRGETIMRTVFSLFLGGICAFAFLGICYQ